MPPARLPDTVAEQGRFSLEDQFDPRSRIFGGKVVPQWPFGQIKLYFEPESRPAGAFWADETLF